MIQVAGFGARGGQRIVVIIGYSGNGHFTFDSALIRQNVG